MTEQPASNDRTTTALISFPPAYKNTQPQVKLRKRPRQMSQRSTQPSHYEGPAQNFIQLCQAFHLVYDQYLRSGYMQSNPQKMRYSVFELLPTSSTFVLIDNSQVGGTATVVEDSDAGLPLDTAFEEDLTALRNSGRKIAEGSMFSSCEEVRKGGGQRRLMRAVLLWCFHHKIDDLCIVINPKHLLFWERVLGFRRLSQQRECSHVRNAPGILLHLDLAELWNGSLAIPRITKRMISFPSEEKESQQSAYQLSEPEATALLLRNPKLFDTTSPRHHRALKRCFPKACKVIEELCFPCESRLVA